VNERPSLGRREVIDAGLEHTSNWNLIGEKGRQLAAVSIQKELACGYEQVCPLRVLGECGVLIPVNQRSGGLCLAAKRTKGGCQSIA